MHGYKKSKIIFRAPQKLTVERCANALGAFVILGIPGILNLLYKKAMSVAMGHGVLAERLGNMILIETEEQIIERDGIDLERNSNDTDPRR